MLPILELQKDKSFRFRLIAACFCMAFLVSIIYVIVSYRLAADLGIEAELTSLHRQAMMLHAELTGPDDKVIEHLSEQVKLAYLNDHVSANKLYVEAQGPDINWSLAHNMNMEQIHTLKKALNLKQTQTKQPVMANGVESFNGKRFLWQIVEAQGYKILIIETVNSLESALSLVAKRLSITSIIVFWLAVWLAITLSSWMNKRVQSKNDSLAKLATHDSLTGLPNRLYLNNLLQGIMPATSTSPPTKLDKSDQDKPLTGSLFVIGMDKFKEVNDAFGHAAGDSLLKKITQRLLAALDNQHSMVRFGGDEFIIWAANLPIDAAILLAKDLLKVCDKSIMINQLAINTGASIGLAHYPTHANNAESLIICADSAMYDAKQKRTGWSVFDQRNPETGQQRLRLRADLNEAFAQQQIHLYYQPKVALGNRRIIGVEALARWHHPTKGILTPTKFIDLIEQSGRVQEFGRYIIRLAVAQLAQWQTQGIDTPIAINLSPYNLLDPGLLDFTQALLKEQGLPPGRLEIELVESSTSINIEQLFPLLNRFRETGIRLAIDDFGTGMSSLSYISKLNVDVIKIDRSFITNIDTDTKNQAIVTTALALANALGNQVIAEGIETLAQLETLKVMGCRYGQGYYFAKPMPANDIITLLQNKPSLPISAT